LKKKILIITDNLISQINGVVTTFKSIEKYALRDGYEISYLDPCSFRYINAPKYPEVKLSIPWRIGKKILSFDPDYIHIATEGPLGLFARYYLDWYNFKYNTSYHTKYPEFIKKIYGIPEWITYSYVRWFHKHSGKVLTTTKTMVNELIDHGFKNNIVSWTRGVDREIFKSDKLPNTGIPTVLFVGRISKEKNLEALCQLHHKYRIQIIGDGPELKNLKSKYPSIEYKGYQHGQVLADYYASANVFCFPSKTDTFGIVIIEALNFGTPVAAYSVPGPIDILENGITGFMSDDLDNNIQKCLMLDRNKIQKDAEKWTWEECWKIFETNLINLHKVDTGL